MATEEHLNLEQPAEEAAAGTEAAAEPEPQPAIPPEPVDPPRSRFLFVDVAALRAKQLRRGARPRIEAPPQMKAERVAMEEVARGLVPYELPEFKGRTAAEL